MCAMSLSRRVRWLTESYQRVTLGIAARLSSSVFVESSSRVISRAIVLLAVLSVGSLGIQQIEAKRPPKPQPMVINGGSMMLAPQVVGVPLSIQISITGGTPPYTCLPDPNNNLTQFGLVLEKTCVLHGTPTKAGTVTF